MKIDTKAVRPEAEIVGLEVQPTKPICIKECLSN